ncbi:MAG TPA: 4-hydroxy-tetrahydrodipicolinate reductase [Erysipelotrichaceae bacterium]|nr:4-hydroxy-tetrahydrodipicolinate reductase [Erysipelotrichaceae bacterium]
MQLLIVGYTGKMGIAIQSLLKQYPQIEATGLSRHEHLNCVSNILDTQGIDLILDFSKPDALGSYLPYAVTHHIPCVIATTGYSDEQLLAIRTASETIPLFYSANFSKGIHVLKQLIKKMNDLCPEDHVDLTDIHHIHKADAPSGTAKALIETIQTGRAQALSVISDQTGLRADHELHLHVSRLGSVVGEHSVIYSSELEAIELKHTAYTKTNFAKGALDAAVWLMDKEPGYYTMEDLYGNVSK